MITRRSMMLGVAALTATAHARSLVGKRLQAARAVALDLMAQNPIVGLSIAVTRGGELVWAEAFGHADIELEIAATPRHRFRLGSVSKIITATLAAQLAARGEVDLDAGISRYL